MAAESESGEIDAEELQDRVIGRQMQNLTQGKAFEEFMTSRLESEMDELDAQIDKRLENVDLENMSEEERSKIREELIRLVKDGMMLDYVFGIYTNSHPLENLPSEQRDPQHSISPEYPKPDFAVPMEEFSLENWPHITALNRALISAARGLERGRLKMFTVQETWKAYARCRGALRLNPSSVPDEAWQLLWNCFANEASLNNKHVKLLGDDMIAAGLSLRDWQRLFYIQAESVEGGRLAAIEQWESCEMTLGKNPDTFKDYWELGISMYGQNNQLDKVLKAAKVLVQTAKDPTEFRIFLPIIQAFLSSDHKGRARMAWALYIRLRLRMGQEMEMKDYDAVISMFFAADLPHLALGVFKDMMLRGDASAKRYDSVAHYASDPGVMSDHDLLKVGQKELTWEDSRALARLPAKFRNKFFFGKWLKKLIAEGQFDASITVFNLMNEQGVRPDPRYMNGLIGAWLRTGKARYHRLAEDTAWRMIQERLDYVENQGTAPVLEFPLRTVRGASKVSYKEIHKHPPATIETFSILIEDYRRRQRHDRMKDLLATIERAKIRPNTFFMNQLMMVGSEVQQFWAWDTYTSFTQNSGVQPDWDTFDYLWWLAKRAVDPIRSSPIKNKNKPTLARGLQTADIPRTMFAEMTKWVPVLTQKGRQMTKEVYDRIILCFSLAQDHSGTAVALRALQRHFNMFPSEETVRTVVLQLAATGLERQPGLSPRRLNLRRSPAVKERVVQVTRLLEGFKKQRVDTLLQQGIVFEELEGDAKLEESLVLMTGLLRHITQIRSEGGNVDRAFKTAAKQMGVPDCSLNEDSSGLSDQS
jgi:hypothetical protein